MYGGVVKYYNHAVEMKYANENGVYVGLHMCGNSSK